MATLPALTVSVAVVFKRGTRYRPFFKKLFSDLRRGVLTHEEAEAKSSEFIRKNIARAVKVK